MVNLPFNKNKEKLGSTLDAARRRFFALKTKLERNPKMREQYNQLMKVYEESKHIELLPILIKDAYFTPHHAILKESCLTTILRAVFDASFKSATGISLNDCLMVGPTIQDGVFELILRFRVHLFAMTADIEKMYRQFLVHPSDRKYQCILWQYNKNEPLKAYQLNTITYGTSCARFLATRCLKQLAEDEMNSFPRASSVLAKDFFVDDLVTGADEFEEAKKLRDELIMLTDGAGLKLRKWISNDKGLMEEFNQCEDDL
ncbi:uncharacterized protein LOC122503093 [Leptopilina heterotoma]|uniref:uncharacterized protein LOC122503093 n=1 Tax=Leptopilina heterotoma TaxID=63436 RepID=UPI001CAA2A0A|nr:uncharacterized protein LOC122503093 [Leptopilina heterotoma]